MQERRESRFRDYVYVSARKVVRMSKTLEPSAWSRVRDVEVKLGPVGATLNFDSGARAEDVIVLVAEVERAIRQRFGVRELNDRQLRVGHWFQVTGQPGGEDGLAQSRQAGALPRLQARRLNGR